MRNGMSCSEAGLLGALASKITIEKTVLERIEEYEKNPKLCKKCNLALPYKNHTQKNFCNQSCAASFNNVGKIRKKNIYCIECNKEIFGRGKKYCNNACQIAKQTKIQLQNAENGKIKLSAVSCKRILINQHGNKCMKCGWDKINEKSGKSPIELTHIDGNSENNDFSNLELICPNCHSLTPNYKSLNNGNGRHKRRERYQQGLSY